jgi:hypothetical protein
MENNLENAVYCQLVDLVKAIINQNHLEKFGISKAIYNEIIEEISRSGENIEQLTLPPKVIAFEKKLIRIFEMNDPKILGVECELWVGESASELTLCAEFEISDSNQIILRYRIIETQ